MIERLLSFGDGIFFSSAARVDPGIQKGGAGGLVTDYPHATPGLHPASTSSLSTTVHTIETFALRQPMH
jgi:hypothetical protein